MYVSVAQKLPEIWPETWMYQFCDFCIFCVLVKKIRQFLQNLVFAKKYFLTFLAISLAIFELQRCTIPHFNPLNNSFWRYGEPFCCRVNSFWVTRPNVSTIFLCSHFIWSQVTSQLRLKRCSLSFSTADSSGLIFDVLCYNQTTTTLQLIVVATTIIGM